MNGGALLFYRKFQLSESDRRSLPLQICIKELFWHSLAGKVKFFDYF